MIKRKIQAGIISITICSIVLSFLLPLNLSGDPSSSRYEPSNIAGISLAYTFFITIGVFVLGIPLSVIAEKIIRSITDHALAIKLFLLLAYYLVPWIVFQLIWGEITEPLLYVFAWIVGTAYFIVDSLVLESRFNNKKFYNKVFKATVVFIVCYLGFVMLSMTIIGLSS
ncbi:hypothetical protein [Caldalkalibacillus thermarum]|uniref:hypothetical protein n=1 Tax=Caldalkalibacillus thermarum TaxID=296745 RepID=UPI00166C202C|nr:hypothetical protein [Caldalkalibacillus thermarum]